MGLSPTYHPPEGEECGTSVEHGLPLWAEPAVGNCSRRPRPSPMWGSRFVGARAVGPWVGEQKPLGKSPLRGNPSPESTYLPTSFSTASVASPYTAYPCFVLVMPCHVTFDSWQAARFCSRTSLGGLVCAPLRPGSGNPWGGALLDLPPRSAAAVHCLRFSNWPIALTMAWTASWGTPSCCRMCRTSHFRFVTRLALVFESVMSANRVR